MNNEHPCAFTLHINKAALKMPSHLQAQLCRTVLKIMNQTKQFWKRYYIYILYTVKSKQIFIITFWNKVHIGWNSSSVKKKICIQAIAI